MNNRKIILHDIDFLEKPLYSNVLIKVYGNIHCGTPNLIDDNIEGYLEIPREMIGEGEFFVLRAKGDSMIDAGINDGTLLIIKKQTYADDGQIVVAYINHSEVALKRYFKLTNEKRFCLHSDNEKYKDIITIDCEVLGIAVKILKDI